MTRILRATLGGDAQGVGEAPADQAGQDAALRPRGGTAVATLTVAMVAIGGLLAVAAASAFEGWAHAIVIGAIVTTAVGLMIAIVPNRRG